MESATLSIGWLQLKEYPVATGQGDKSFQQ